jgi:ABC-2 type transport system ATP-binding protein
MNDSRSEPAGPDAESQSSEAVVELSEVCKRFGDRTALDRVTLSVRKGEVFGLLGPNGAGKTTAVRILLAIIGADSGSVRLFQQPLSRALLDRVGYLPEERGLYMQHTVLDAMTYLGALKGLRDAELKARARVWLERVGLEGVEQLSVSKLSKGMSQKVQLAATLQSEPALCILDEPFSGLDPVSTVVVREMIDSLRRAGQTVILSTHQMAMVESLCDRVGLLFRGKLLEYGAVREVRRRHSRVEVRVAAPNLPGMIAASRVEFDADGTFRVALDPGQTPEQLLSQLVHAGAHVSRFEPVLASMEEIFIRIAAGIEVDP